MCYILCSLVSKTAITSSMYNIINYWSKYKKVKYYRAYPHNEFKVEGIVRT